MCNLVCKFTNRLLTYTTRIRQKYNYYYFFFFGLLCFLFFFWLILAGVNHKAFLAPCLQTTVLLLNDRAGRFAILHTRKNYIRKTTLLSVSPAHQLRSMLPCNIAAESCVHTALNEACRLPSWVYNLTALRMQSQNTVIK